MAWVYFVEVYNRESRGPDVPETVRVEGPLANKAAAERQKEAAERQGFFASYYRKSEKRVR